MDNLCFFQIDNIDNSAIRTISSAYNRILTLTFQKVTPIFKFFISTANEFKNVAKIVGESFWPCLTPAFV